MIPQPNTRVTIDPYLSRFGRYVAQKGVSQRRANIGESFLMAQSAPPHILTKRKLADSPFVRHLQALRVHSRATDLADFPADDRYHLRDPAHASAH